MKQRKENKSVSFKGILADTDGSNRGTSPIPPPLALVKPNIENTLSTHQVQNKNVPPHSPQRRNSESPETTSWAIFIGISSLSPPPDPATTVVAFVIGVGMRGFTCAPNRESWIYNLNV